MWTAVFWKQAAERAIKGAIVAVMAAWPIGDGVLNAFDVDWAEAGGLALGGAIVSLGLSIVSSVVGPSDSPSLVETK
jgi:hypothetical protein